MNAPSFRRTTRCTRTTRTTRTTRFARGSALASVLTLVALGACGSDTPTDDALRPASELRVSLNDAAGTAIALTPKAATLVLGHGILLQARVLDAGGQPVAGARASWRSTNAAVVTVNALPDSGLAVDQGRAAVRSIAAGTAMIIASYESRADTATITVVPRTDSVPSQPPPRAKTFDLTARVQGVLATNAAGDSASRHQLLPGAQVTLTLLPLQRGDSVAAGTAIITTPTVVGTRTADAQGRVFFPGLTVTRYRLTVVPPAGTAWEGSTTEYSPPYWGTMFSEVWLRKP